MLVADDPLVLCKKKKFEIRCSYNNLDVEPTAPVLVSSVVPVAVLQLHVNLFILQDRGYFTQFFRTFLVDVGR